MLLATDQIYGFRGHGPTVPLGPTTALNSVELTLSYAHALPSCGEVGK